MPLRKIGESIVPAERLNKIRRYPGERGGGPADPCLSRFAAVLERRIIFASRRFGRGTRFLPTGRRAVQIIDDPKHAIHVFISAGKLRDARQCAQSEYTEIRSHAITWLNSVKSSRREHS